MNKIQKSCYGVNATVEILNKVIAPIALYTSMAIYPNEEIVNRIQKRMDNIVYRKLRVGGYNNAAWRLQVPKEEGGIGLMNLMAECLTTYWSSLLREANKGNKHILQVLKRENSRFKVKYPGWELRQEDKEASITNYIKGRKERCILRYQKVTVKEVCEQGTVPEKYLKGMTNTEKAQIRKQIGKGIHRQIRIIEGFYPRIRAEKLDVFTDAGKRNDKVTMGVYIPGRGEWTEVLMSNWKQSVQIGELWIILLALKMIDKTTNIRAFSDNKNAVTAIRKRFTKGKHGGIVAAIIKEIEEREKEGATTEISHINSHLRDGKKKKETVERQEKIMRQKYGDELEYLIEGNAKADKLTQTEVEEELISHKGWRSTEWYFTWQGEQINRKDFTNILTQIWITTRQTYEELHDKGKHNKKRTKQWMTGAKGKIRQQVRLCQQINIGKLPTRQRLNKKMEEGQIDLPMVYLYKHCPYHEHQVEDETHFTKCLETRKKCKNLPREILRHINKGIDKANEKREEKKAKIFWFKPIYGKLEEDDKQASWEIWKGLIPKQLEIEIHNIIGDKEEEKLTINKIMNSVTKFTSKRWKHRCSKLFSQEQ